MKIPEYRVRLFLSVDLTGSTDFKHKNSVVLDWSKVFQSFYGDFPNLLRNEYLKIAQDEQKCKRLSDDEREKGYPKLWKTVGDEILFCCRLTSQLQLGICMDAFISVLKTYGCMLDKNSHGKLNTKGNAWIASFPTPNCSIRPITSTSDNDNALLGKYELPTEAREQEVDETPHKFDFLGKGIDAGFRISKNSAVDSLTISPGLGYLLAETRENFNSTGFQTEFILSEMQQFKGVANGSPYPVLTIDTIRDDKQREILTLQREFLKISEKVDYRKMSLYLKQYLQEKKIEVPVLKVHEKDINIDLPDYYNLYKKRWVSEKENIEQENENILESAKSDGTLSKDVARNSDQSSSGETQNFITTYFKTNFK